MAQGIFKIVLPLRDRHVFISESFKRFQYFNFETNFLENKNLFEKLNYRFLAEATKPRSHIIPIQKCSVRSQYVKANRMATTKWTYHKE